MPSFIFTLSITWNILYNQHGDNAFLIDFAQASHPEQEPVRQSLFENTSRGLTSACLFGGTLFPAIMLGL